MSSDYLKAIAAGGEFDQTEAIRELARVLTEGPITVKGSITGGGLHGVALGEEVIPPLVDAPEPATPKKKK